MTTAPCPCLSRSTLLLTRRVSLIRLLMLCLPLLAMLAALPQLRAQELAPIDLRQPPQQWQSLFTALASHPRIESDFTELRYFPFRRFPRQLEGRMVFDHGRGMALEYLSPSRYTVFVQPQGGIRIVRGADTDEVPQNAASATMLRLMPQLMVFSPKALADTFNARGQMQEGGNWQLSLKPPRIGDLPGVQEIRMSGSLSLIHI